MRLLCLLVAMSAFAQSPIEQQRAAIARQRESIRRQAAGLGLLGSAERTVRPYEPAAAGSAATAAQTSPTAIAWRRQLSLRS